MTRYYIAHEDANVPAVYQIDEDWLAHTVPDWEAIEENSSRVWITSCRHEAYEVAKLFRHYGATVRAYRA